MRYVERLPASSIREGSLRPISACVCSKNFGIFSQLPGLISGVDVDAAKLKLSRNSGKKFPLLFLEFKIDNSTWRGNQERGCQRVFSLSC